MAINENLDPSALYLENQLCHRLYVASNLLTRIYRPLLTPLDLTYPQYLIMLALWELDDVSILNIMKRTRIDGGSLSLILKKLVSKKMVTICGCPQDKRKKKVKLTHKAKCLRNKALEVNQELKCRFGGIFSEDEFRHFVHAIDNMNDSIIDKVGQDKDNSLGDYSEGEATKPNP
jgi:MarR family transcriptional regulator, organic hydroperoxide resistance regulator